MSVMGLSAESFKRNLNGVLTFHHVYSFGSHVDYDRIIEVFKRLQELNNLSYNQKYNEQCRFKPYQDIVKVKDHKNIPSLLKSLQCLAYNIELTKEQENHYDNYEALTFLKREIKSISSYLISEMEEYKVAEWR